jgi:1,2-diacylglycerol-3-alpha-glucose alpha-1,2-glucosyltransferase
MDVKRAIKHRPKNVLMPGYIDNAIIKGAYRYAECLFFPSYEETEGIVVLESLASSCPTLIRDIGVYADWLENERDCYKAKNNEEFLAQLDKLMNADNKHILEEGMKRVDERTLEVVGKQLKEAYEYVLNKCKK